MRWVPVLLSCLLLASCGDEGTVTIVVELRTDFVPGVELASVRTEMDDPARTDDRSALRGEDFVSGTRVAELTDVPKGLRRITARLLDSDGSELARRSVLVDVERDRGVTLVVTRDCQGVSCGAGETCAGGTCVSETCLEESTADCGSECTSSTDCPAMAACASAGCVTGLCVYGEAAGACGATEYCDVASGCVDLGPPPPPPTDACIATDEVCNGMDDDCNGMVDDVAGVGDPCGTDEGACAMGVMACQGSALVCAGGIDPQGERCNGDDDDCDGVIDNGVCCVAGFTVGMGGTPTATICMSGPRGPSSYADAEADCADEAGTGAVIADPRRFVPRVCGTYWQEGPGVTCWDGGSSFEGSCSVGGTVTTTDCSFSCGAATADCTNQYYYCQTDYIP